MLPPFCGIYTYHEINTLLHISNIQFNIVNYAVQLSRACETKTLHLFNNTSPLELSKFECPYSLTQAIPLQRISRTEIGYISKEYVKKKKNLLQPCCNNKSRFGGQGKILPVRELLQELLTDTYSSLLRGN